MKSSPYNINDVLSITRKGETVLARVAGYVDQLDDTKPLYVNLRTNDNNYWKRSDVKIMPSQINQMLPNWEADQQAAYDIQNKAFIDALWARMTPAQKRRVHEDAVRLGIVREQRTGLDILIDRAVGLE